jgi:hypothetical protein
MGNEKKRIADQGKKKYDRDRELNDSTLHETSKFTLEHTPE